MRVGQASHAIRGALHAATVSPTASTLAAQYLNSGIFPNGSSAGLVNVFAAASAKQKGTKTTPAGTAPSARP